MTLADLMLLEVLARGHGTLVLKPEGTTHTLAFDSGGSHLTLARVPTALADATQARLALIADASLIPPSVARIRVTMTSHQGAPDAGVAEVLMCQRTTAAGLACELHALADARRADESSIVSGIDGVPAPTPEAAKYQVMGELGRGGMGIVYRALHVALDKEVALKVLTPMMAQRKALAAQFVVEARAAGRASHPGIVNVTDFGRLSDGRNFLVMEIVEWPTLAEELERGRIPIARALKIARGIADGLAAAHAFGVVHRDLKPSNVFVDAAGRVKVGDFGLAYTYGSGGEDAPLEGLLFGTVPYMAPEQATGAAVDHRTDIYSFGCILYELLSGSAPYSAARSEEIVQLHQTAAIPPLELEGQPTPERLSALVSSLLSKDPDGRPASFEDVIVELDACAEALP